MLHTASPFTLKADSSTIKTAVDGLPLGNFDLFRHSQPSESSVKGAEDEESGVDQQHRCHPPSVPALSSFGSEGVEVRGHLFDEKNWSVVDKCPEDYAKFPALCVTRSGARLWLNGQPGTFTSLCQRRLASD